jgi:hypothetical protein
MGLPADLPPGRMVTPKVWVSDDQVADVTTVWARLHAEHASTGWWPLLLYPDVDLRDFGQEHEVTVSAEEFLAQRWQLGDVQVYTDPAMVEMETALIPYTTWPGLAPAGPPGPDPDQVAAAYVTSTEVRAGAVSDPFTPLSRDPNKPVPNPFVGTGGAFLGLVESPDSAGAIAASGWEHQLGGGPGGTPVLRSWQERFGVRLCVLGYDWLSVSVARPTGELDLARRLAAEHVAFCPDVAGEIPFEDYARGLIEAAVWRFWWD